MDLGDGLQQRYHEADRERREKGRAASFSDHDQRLPQRGGNLQGVHQIAIRMMSW